MSFLYDNLAAIVCALVASALAWVFGGSHAEPFMQMAPWLIGLVLEALLFFPQRERGESTYEARERVWKGLRRDPFFLTAFFLTILLCIPFVNNGLCTGCDAQLIRQGLSPEPPVSFLPFCVNRLQHLDVVYWIVLALLIAATARLGLTRRGKILTLEMIVWNGFALAILGFVQIAANAPGALWSEVDVGGDFFASFSYPNMAGDYFTTLFGISFGLWRWKHDEVLDDLPKDDADAAHRQGVFWRKHFYLIPTALFYFAAINTLSRAAIVLVTSICFIGFLHTFFSFLNKRSRAAKLKFGVITLGVFGIVIFFASIFMPENLQREVDTLDAETVLTRVTGKGQYHIRVATEIWKDNWLFGCGGWGYKHFCVPKMTPAEIRAIQMVGGINVHNDYLQYLAEHGIVGFGALVALVIILLVPVVRVWRALIDDARFTKKKNLPAKPIEIFVLPAGAFFVLLTALATFGHGFADCPLRSPAVFTLFFLSLAAVPGFLPHIDFEELKRERLAREQEKQKHHHHHHHHHEQPKDETPSESDAGNPKREEN